MLRLGIDVGGTNTDAVVLDGDQVVATTKIRTTPEVTRGIVQAITTLSEGGNLETSAVAAVMVGTTQFLNALIQRRQLAPTAAIRFGLPATAAVPPMVDWPVPFREAIAGQGYLCHGGHEYDGSRAGDFDEREFRDTLEAAVSAGARSFAISSVFSPINAEFELRAAEIIAAELPHAPVSLSHEIGRTGLLSRENATIINAALRELADEAAPGLRQAILDTGITAPVFLSQNDGTLMDIDYARRYPVATFSSGPTNSMRGAALLSRELDCAVVDMGGTTTDVGTLQHGFPRAASTDVRVAGVTTSFRMPDVLSIGIGGGSRVRLGGAHPQVGPDSVGYLLSEQALVFGGDQLTATDIAVAAGLSELGDPRRVRHLDRGDVRAALASITTQLTDALHRMRATVEPTAMVAVGGGSMLVPERIDGVTAVVRPAHHAVANAIGAAIAEVSGEVDRVVYASPGRRHAALDEARQEAVDRAVAAGAQPQSVRIVETAESPLAYLPGYATRVRVKAIGQLALQNPGSRSTRPTTVRGEPVSAESALANGPMTPRRGSP